MVFGQVTANLNDLPEDSRSSLPLQAGYIFGAALQQDPKGCFIPQRPMGSLIKLLRSAVGH